MALSIFFQTTDLNKVGGYLAYEKKNDKVRNSDWIGKHPPKKLKQKKKPALQEFNNCLISNIKPTRSLTNNFISSNAGQYKMVKDV